MRCSWSGAVAGVLATAALAHGQVTNRTQITSLFYTPDGATVVAACLDDYLHLYDAATGKQRSTIMAHKDGVWCAALSADGTRIVTGGGDYLAKLWDTTGFKELKSFEGHKKEVFAVALSPDGKTLASGGGDKSIRLWDTATGKETAKWHGHELGVLALAFSPDGKTLASAGTCTATIPGVIAGAIHADQIRLWDVAGAKEIKALTMRGTTVAFSPDGRRLAGGGNYATGKMFEGGGAMLIGGTSIDLASAAGDASYATVKGQGSAVAFSADGRLLVTAHGSRLLLGKYVNENEMVHRRATLLDVATGKELLQISQDSATVVAVAPNAKKVAMGFAHGTVTFADLTPPGMPSADDIKKLGAKDLLDLWADFGGEALAAYRAVWIMAALGEPAVAFLDERMQPDKVDAEAVRMLVKKLDDAKFGVRESAASALKKMGPNIDAELRAALTDGKLGQEGRERVKKLVDAWHKRPSTTAETRLWHGMQVLAWIGSPDARKVLARLADGAAGTWVTEQSRATLARLPRAEK